jgi:hypothetical protein
MKHEGGRAVLETLEGLPLKGHGPATREAQRQLVQYLGNNLHRMDYPRYLANGWQIGSGPVESACKSVVGQRLKGPGMRWGEPGTDALCHLRALYKSEPSQWSAFWNHHLN